MEQRISLITLGVANLAAAATFYESLGWQRVKTEEAGIIVFDLRGQVLGLYPKDKLAEDLGLDIGTLGPAAMTLGYNVRAKAEVSDIFDRAVAGGGKGLKPPFDIFWGGHSAFFADLDGHAWEISYNPFSPVREDGAFQWGG